jgi:hypothetical protein
MAYTFLTSSKLLISSLCFPRFSPLLLSHLIPFKIYILDVVPRIDLNFSSTWWSNYLEGHLQATPVKKGRRVWINVLPLVHTNGSVKTLTLFLPGLALLHSPRTKYSIAWLEIFRPVRRHCHIWRNSPTFPKTSHPCNVSRSTYKICTSEFNVSNSTTLRLPHQLPSITTEARVKENEDINNCGQPWP